jgi:hypothetical protein
MDDVTRQDRRLLVRELLSPARLIISLAGLVMLWGFHSVADFFVGNVFVALGLAGVAWMYIGSSLSDAKRKRFIQRHYEALWLGCRDRLARFEEVFKKMRRDQIADLQIMPKTIRSVAEGLYRALRRADMISDEIMKTERGIYVDPPSWTAAPKDPQANELYRIADRNIAEYKQQFAGVMAGVHRAEAQSAVFMTTLDNLRMKMLGYRLVGKTPEIPSQDFLEALSEAKLQLDAIDKALDELDLSILPKTIAVVRPESEENHVEQR